MKALLKFLAKVTPIASLGAVFALSGCSDPSRPTAQAAFSAIFGNYGAVACPATTPSPEISVGSVTATQKSSVADGQDGALISCTVSKSGEELHAEGSISQGSTSLTLFPLVISKGKVSKGRLQVSSASTLGPYTPADPQNEPCEFTLIDGDPGRIWLKFSCKHMVLEGSLQSDCSLYNGYMVFENCDE